MAKVRHRVFEIYESVDEAIRELTSRTEKIAVDVSDPDSWNFKHLAVEREAGVTLVRFTDPQIDSEEIINGIRDDFTLLAGHLNKDSRILLDFTGLETSNASLITTLELFSKKLRTKGSRIVLCGLGPTVRETFFAIG